VRWEGDGDDKAAKGNRPNYTALSDHRYMEFSHEKIRSDVCGRGIVGFH
jgi:hypothetical protein